MNQDYPPLDCSYCTLCKKYKLFMVFYGFLTMFLNIVVFSCSVMITYNIQSGTIELSIQNKKLIETANIAFKLSNHTF